MAIKTQYIASDGETFDNADEAMVYEKSLERAKDSEREYRVMLTVLCICYVNAHNEYEAIKRAQDEWCAGNLTDSETILESRAEVYDEKEW